MKAILFSGIAMLDRQDVRQSLVRIPEVIQKIRQAQVVVDQITNYGYELHNCMLDDDKFLVAHPKIRRVLVNTVQIALYERHVKSYHKPQFFVGSLCNASAIEYCLGLCFFEELIRSVWYQNLDQVETEADLFESQSKYQDIQKVHRLYNQKNNYYVYEFQKDEMLTVDSKKIDEAESYENLISKLIQEYGVKQIVNLAPTDVLLNPKTNPFSLEDIQVFNTLEIDPMLSWFYQKFAC